MAAPRQRRDSNPCRLGTAAAALRYAVLSAARIREEDLNPQTVA